MQKSQFGFPNVKERKIICIILKEMTKLKTLD